jgi:hypothetical protein
MMKRFRLTALIAIGVLVAAAVALMLSVGPRLLDRLIAAAWSEPPRRYHVADNLRN